MLRLTVRLAPLFFFFFLVFNPPGIDYNRLVYAVCLKRKSASGGGFQTGGVVSLSKLKRHVDSEKNKRAELTRIRSFPFLWRRRKKERKQKWMNSRKMESRYLLTDLIELCFVFLCHRLYLQTFRRWLYKVHYAVATCLQILWNFQWQSVAISTT